MIYREVMDDERYAFIIGWAETNNAQYDTRVKNGRVQVGLSAYHWRRAEYQGVAAWPSNGWLSLFRRCG